MKPLLILLIVVAAGCERSPSPSAAEVPVPAAVPRAPAPPPPRRPLREPATRPVGDAALAKSAPPPAAVKPGVAATRSSGGVRSEPTQDEQIAELLQLIAARAAQSPSTSGGKP